MKSFFDLLKRKSYKDLPWTGQDDDLMVEKDDRSIVLRVNGKGNIIDLNEFALGFFGFSKEAITGRSVIGSIMPNTELAKCAFASMIGEIKHNDEHNTIYEEENIRHNGERVWVMWKNKAIRDENGQLIEILCVGNDITERKLLKEQLLHSQKMETIGRLAGGIAHDFNNMMTIVNGYSERILNRLNGQDQIREEIEQISKAGKRSISLAQQLLSYSNGQISETKKLDLNEIILDMEKMLKRLLGENLNLVSCLTDEKKNIKADPGQLGQIIMNLALNARDAMPEGGQLTIGTRRIVLSEKDCKDIPQSHPGEYICLVVEDTGIGMDKKTLDNIFKPFFSTKGPAGGTGLGLSIVKDIVENHEGWINAYSKSGEGSIFKVYFPTFFIGPDEVESKKKALQVLHGNGEKILVVEDDNDVRGFAKKTLCEMGYTVFEAETTEKALNIFENENREFNMIFCDVVLPGKSGLHLADQILARKPEIKILMSSGYSNDKSQIINMNNDNISFLKKPYSVADLLMTVKSNLVPESLSG